MHPVRIDVRSATGSYPVIIGDHLAARLGDVIDERRRGSRRFVVTNPVVWRFHGDAIANSLPDATVIQVPDGERQKHLASVSRIYEALVRADADRGAVIVALGGGVIGDMAGFVAATYLRGVPFVQVPTTLLAQVDASVGGKVGVNLPAGKNMVGSFYPPIAVVTDPSLLSTLPRREFRAGLYEVIKYGMACSAELFEQLEQSARRLTEPAPDVIGPIIATCCEIKARVVSTDEHESGLRRVLNFGHTAGHAIESVTAYRRFRHGEAVGWGMLVAGLVSVGRGLLGEAEQARLRALVMSLGPLPPISDLDITKILEAMRRDKKIVDGKLHFVLPSGVGTTAIVDDVTTAELQAALTAVGFAAR